MPVKSNDYKWMAYSGVGDYMVVAKAKSALAKICRAYAKDDYRHYVETCEYLEEPADALDIDDFNMVDWIEKYDPERIDYMIRVNGLLTIHEIDRDGSYITSGIY